MAAELPVRVHRKHRKKSEQRWARQGYNAECLAGKGPLCSLVNTALTPELGFLRAGGGHLQQPVPQLSAYEMGAMSLTLLGFHPNIDSFFPLGLFHIAQHTAAPLAKEALPLTLPHSCPPCLCSLTAASHMGQSTAGAEGHKGMDICTRQMRASDNASCDSGVGTGLQPELTWNLAPASPRISAPTYFHLLEVMTAVP